MTHLDAPHTPCLVCGFGLWQPISSLSVSHAGLYSDSRFPGRTIVTLDRHFDQLDEVPKFLLGEFMFDVQRVCKAIKHTTGAARVNVSILGNVETHVHAHLIPRKPLLEPFPDKAPWEDPRPKGELTAGQEHQLRAGIRFHLLED